MLVIIDFVLSFMIVFAQHYFSNFIGLSIFPLFALVLSEREESLYFNEVLIVLISVILDVTYHYSLGSILLSTLIFLSVILLFKKIAHSELSVVKLVGIIIAYVSYDIFLHIITSNFNFTVLKDLNWLNVIVIGFVSSLFYLLISRAIIYFRVSKDISQVTKL